MEVQALSISENWDTLCHRTQKSRKSWQFNRHRTPKIRSIFPSTLGFDRDWDILLKVWGFQAKVRKGVVTFYSSKVHPESWYHLRNRHRCIHKDARFGAFDIKQLVESDFSRLLCVFPICQGPSFHMYCYFVSNLQKRIFQEEPREHVPDWVKICVVVSSQEWRRHLYIKCDFTFP